jgi:hypothetical protein
VPVHAPDHDLLRGHRLQRVRVTRELLEVLRAGARRAPRGRSGSPKIFRETGVGFVVYKAELTFKEAAVHGDRLEVRYDVRAESAFPRDDLRSGACGVRTESNRSSAARSQLVCVESQGKARGASGRGAGAPRAGLRPRPSYIGARWRLTRRRALGLGNRWRAPRRPAGTFPPVHDGRAAAGPAEVADGRAVLDPPCGRRAIPSGQGDRSRPRPRSASPTRSTRSSRPSTGLRLRLRTSAARVRERRGSPGVRMVGFAPFTRMTPEQQDHVLEGWRDARSHLPARSSTRCWVVLRCVLGRPAHVARDGLPRTPGRGPRRG